ncbi:MAG: PBP1A family penicillin-binding protein [Desulfobacterales bacterium]|nr:PBP1A family penicillin-binding protein [Desulfobacterales bacterium]
MKRFLGVISLFRFLFFSGLILGALGVLAAVFLIFSTAPNLPKLPQDLNRIAQMPQSVIYSASGDVLLQLGEQKSIPLNLVSPDFINAILSTEDHLFFQHRGVNKLRTLKALYVTFFTPGRKEGGSTITQQLAKNLFFSFEQSFERKFKELLVAFQIEAAHSKEEILEAYINQIHFGAGAQGIEKAANTFFNKSAMELTLPEAALLAGLPKSPTAYNPFRHYDRALKRRGKVLQRMVASGFISPEVAREANGIKPVLVRTKKDSRSGSYFLDELIRRLIDKYGESVVLHGGIRVFSTLDSRLQAQAEAAVKGGLKRLDKIMGTDTGLQSGDIGSPDLQGALVSIDTGSGAVKAMVGGRDYYQSEYNRAVNSRRQPGSGFKPFVYYAAFQARDYHPGTVMRDQPVVIPVVGAPDWKPRNYERTYQGDMVLKRALTHSVNTITAQLVADIGPEAVIDTARACGIQSPLRPVYSIALGSSDVTPFEMARAYTVFANMGVMREPFFFWRVEDAFGRVLDEQIVQDTPVLDPATVYQVVDMMESVVDRGSGRNIRRAGFKRATAGKTGTTNAFNDAWFTGFTPELCTSVWVGFDRKRKLKDKRGFGITGGRGAAPIWADYMIQALKGEPERKFHVPAHIRRVEVDPVTGCPPLDSDPDPSPPISIPLRGDQEVCPEVTP